MNAMRRAKEEGKEKRVRFDVCLVDGPLRNIITPTACRLLGTTPLRTTAATIAADEKHDSNFGEVVLLSDHFGVCCHFSL